MFRAIKYRKVHSFWAYNKKKGWSVLITVYRPDPKRWINCKIRIDNSMAASSLRRKWRRSFEAA